MKSLFLNKGSIAEVQFLLLANRKNQTTLPQTREPDKPNNKDKESNKVLEGAINVLHRRSITTKTVKIYEDNSYDDLHRHLPRS